MEILNLGMTILLAGTFLFFLVFFILCSGWAKELHPERRAIIGFLVSILSTFLVFFGGLFVLGLILLFSKYLLPTIKIWKSLL